MQILRTRCAVGKLLNYGACEPVLELGSGYFQRSLFARKSWPNASCSNSWFSTILRRYVCLWSTWRKGCCLGWQPSAMHIWHKWVRLAVCFSNFQSLPGGLAASRIQIHPCVACAYSSFGIGWKNLRNYCWNRKRFQWETRAPVAKVVWQSGRFLSLQAGCFGSAFAPTSWRVAAIPTTFGSQLHGFVPTRLHPRLFGNFGSFEVGRASRGKPQLFPAGKYSFRKFAGLHLGQHQFCWKPVSVSFDSTWEKRGFTSNHGVGFVISTDTGKVLDYAVISKACNACKINQKRLSQEELELWRRDHDCVGGYEGSSPSMETECARTLWNKSRDHGLEYRFMVSDGDSKAYNSVWDVYGVCGDCNKYEQMEKSSPEYIKWKNSPEYKKWENDHLSGEAGCHRVVKLDCVGHVQKRIGKALRDVQQQKGKLSDGKPVGGRPGFPLMGRFSGLVMTQHKTRILCCSFRASLSKERW